MENCKTMYEKSAKSTHCFGHTVEWHNIAYTTDIENGHAIDISTKYYIGPQKTGKDTHRNIDRMATADISVRDHRKRAYNGIY